jgi:hypothetical protein
LLELEDPQDESSLFRMDFFGILRSEWLVESLHTAAGWRNKRPFLSSMSSSSMLKAAVESSCVGDGDDKDSRGGCVGGDGGREGGGDGVCIAAEVSPKINL